MDIEDDGESGQTVKEPRCIEASATVSLGGKIQIVKFEFTQDYFYSQGGKWSIPEGWTDEQCEEFRLKKAAEFRAALEGPVQDEVNDMMRQRDEFYARERS